MERDWVNSKVDVQVNLMESPLFTQNKVRVTLTCVSLNSMPSSHWAWTIDELIHFKSNCSSNKHHQLQRQRQWIQTKKRKETEMQKTKTWWTS